MHVAALKACNAKDNQGCVDRFAAMRALFPDVVEGYSDAAAPLARLGRVDEAIELLTRGLQIRPGHAASIKSMYDVLRQAANAALAARRCGDRCFLFTYHQMILRYPAALEYLQHAVRYSPQEDEPKLFHTMADALVSS